MAGFRAFVSSAVQARLHVESCHPCLLLAVASQVKHGEVCITPAVVVDPSMTTEMSGSGVRVLAEVENLNDG